MTDTQRNVPRTATTTNDDNNNNNNDRRRRRRRVWNLVVAAAATTMAVTTNGAAAFQSSSLSPQRRRSSSVTTSTTSTSTTTTVACQVVTDPNSVSVAADRAALEELYMLSSLSNRPTTQKAKIKKKTAAAAAAAATTTTPKRLARVQRNDSSHSSSGSGRSIANSSTMLRALKDEVAEFREGRRQQQQFASKEEAPSAETAATMSAAQNTSSPPASRSSSSSFPRFNGLTIKPNRRNKRSKSLTTVSPVTRNPTLRQDLADAAERKEEWMAKKTSSSMSASAPLASSPMGRVDSASSAAIESSKPQQQEQQQQQQPKSRSSTMPGYQERSHTFRQTKVRDGLNLLQQTSGRTIEFSEEEVAQRKKVGGEFMYKSSASVPESLVQFAKELHDVERITPKEEVELGEKTQEAIKLQKIYDGLSTKLKREPTDDEWCAAAGKINMEAIAQAIDEGLEAKNRLVTSNLRMVQGVVNVYIRNGLQGQYNSGDLMQEGILALIRAAEKFDPSRGFRFSTYAMYWIRSAIKRDQISQSRVIQVPPRLYEQHKRLTKIENEIRIAYGRAPSMDELCDATGMTQLQIDRCEDAVSQRIYSLDQNIFNVLKPQTSKIDNGDTLLSLIENKIDEDDTSQIEYELLREDLIRTLYRHLSKEEVNLLMLRFGLTQNRESVKRSGIRTIAEVSRLTGLKPDKIRRLLNRSLNSLQTVIGDEWRDYERQLESGLD